METEALFILPLGNQSGSARLMTVSMEASCMMGVVEQLDKPFGLYGDRVIEILQHVFAPMYKKVWEPNWNNSIFGEMKRPYYFYSFMDGVYEVYVPIGPDGEAFMHYWRIVVKVFEEIDHATIRKEQRMMEIPWITPVGVIDSETIIYVAQRPTEELKSQIRKNGRKAYLRGFRHIRKRGYFTAIFINEAPEIVMNRLLRFLKNFLEKRINGLLDKLKLPSWMFKEDLKKGNIESLLNNRLIESYSITIRTILKNMIETLYWFRDKIKWLYTEIGKQSVLKRQIEEVIPKIKRDLMFIFRGTPPPNIPPLIIKLKQVILDGG